MKLQVQVTENGKTFAGEAVLSEVQPHGRQSRRQQKSVRTARPNKPSEAIHALYGKGFFATARTLGDSMTQLGRDGYNFSGPSILMALKAKEFLQRRGSKGAYRFVQKYPPTA